MNKIEKYKKIWNEYREGKHLVDWQGYIRSWYYEEDNKCLQVKNYKKGKWLFVVSEHFLRGHFSNYPEDEIDALYIDFASCSDAKKQAQEWYLEWLSEK